VWHDPDEDQEYTDEGDPEKGAEVLLDRLERIRRLLWLGAPSIIVENEIRALKEEHEKFALVRRVLS